MNEVPQIFDNPLVDNNRIVEINELPEPRSRYIIAMTPRSGSSYLCDVMKRVKRFGTPDEVLNQQFIPGIMRKIPGRTPEEYMRNIIRCRKTPNGLSGFKTSWFQFRNFTQTMADHSYLDGFKYIYLTRRDASAQAISLYKATTSNIFHTNIQHESDEIDKLNSLKYNYNEIDKWHNHIIKQEKGWQNFFYKNRIFSLCITYEEIEEDILRTMKRIAMFVGVLPENVSLPDKKSVFRKISDSRSLEWAQRFMIEKNSKNNL